MLTLHLIGRSRLKVGDYLMTDDERRRLEEFRRTFHHSQSVCDPLDFAVRQNSLLRAIAKYLIQPLEDLENKERDED